MNFTGNRAETDDYTSTSSKVAFNSSLDGAKADTLAGKKIAHVDASEHRLTLTFSDGSQLEISGATYGDCALGVEMKEVSTQELLTPFVSKLDPNTPVIEE